MGGSGGQGLVLAGVVLGKAAASAGKEVAQTQSYGIASRGGYSESRAVIATEEIIYPDVDSADVLIALTAEAYAKHADHIAPGGLAIVDAEAGVDIAQDRSEEAVRTSCPIVATARSMGYSGSVNMMCLGVLAAATSLLPPEALAAAIRERFANPEVRRRNIESFSAGIKIWRQLGEIPGWDRAAI